jgi:hypothetical protein
MFCLLSFGVLERMSGVFWGCDIMMRGASLFVMEVEPVVGVSALYEIGHIIKCRLTPST